MSNRTSLGVAALLVLASLCFLLPVHAAELTKSPPGEAFDSEYIFKVWQADDGLPANSVTCITQTRDGYLWFGTFNGLARFDGVRFTTFDPDNAPGLVSTTIYGFYSDRAGRLWIAQDNGRLSFWERGRFTEVMVPSFPGQGRNTLSCLGEDAAGELWVGTRQGPCRWRDNKLVPWTAPQSFPVRAVNSLVADSTAQLWCFIMPQVGRIVGERFVPVEDSKVLEGMKLLGTPNDPTGGVWIVGEQQKTSVYCHLSAEGRITEPRPFPWKSGVFTWGTFADRLGHLWIASNGQGLFRLAKDGSYQQWTTETGLSHNVVRAGAEDHEGNIWIGTDGGGVCQLRPRAFGLVAATNGLAEEIVYAVTPAREGGIWIATHGKGVFRWRDGECAPFAKQPAFSWALHEDRGGKLWVGSLLSDGLYEMDAASRKRHGVLQEVRAICEDRHGNLWVGGRGLARGRDEQFTVLTNQWPNSRQIRSIAEDASGTIWIGTRAEGLFAWRNESFTRYSREEGLLHPTVNALCADPDGSLWIGTEGGLARWKDGRFASFTTANGLADKSVRGIADDGQGRLWLTSRQGILRLSRRELEEFAAGRTNTFHCLRYDKEDGLATRECTDGSQPKICRTPDGKLWFATMKGVAVVDPTRLRLNTNAPPVALEAVVVDGTARSEFQMANGPLPVAIAPGAKHLEIHYTALSFTAPGKVRFKYRFEGLQQDWVDAGSRRVVSFDSPPPGAYRFRLQAANEDGVWNEAGATLALNVLPFFWQTLWFRALYLLAMAVMLAWAVHYVSTNRLQRRLALVEKQRAVESERNRISRDMHDDLGARLTKIAFFSEMAEQSGPSAPAENARAVARMSREAAQSLDELVWTIKPVNDTLANLAGYLCQYTSEYFAQTPIRVRFDLPRVVPDHPLTAEVRHQLFLVVKEAHSNIIKHAAANEVLLRMTVEPRSFSLVIADNGSGLAASATSPEADGLANMKRRIEALGGRFELKARLGGGTEVNLDVPLRDR